jgi:hypothetical protein
MKRIEIVNDYIEWVKRILKNKRKTANLKSRYEGNTEVDPTIKKIKKFNHIVEFLNSFHTEDDGIVTLH